MQCSFKSFSLISLFFVAFTGLFISCSQVTPEIYTTDYSVIFDYRDEEALPSARLSVFASSASDVRRYERISIKSLDSGYIWDTWKIERLDTYDLQWVGCTNLIVPEEEKLPSGKYEVTYYNADEKECTVTLDVKYDIELYDVLLSELSEFMKKKHGIQKIAVYDKEHIMIYFGDRTEEFKTTRGIWNAYREAATYQVIWYAGNGSVICVEPEKTVTPNEE